MTPDDARRTRQLPWTFRAVLRYCRRDGAIYTTSDVGGVSCWLPPSASSTNVLGMLRSGKLFAPVRLGPSAFVRIMNLSAYMTAERKRIMPMPHWYLIALGVEPAHQGEGLGAALLELVLA